MLVVPNIGDAPYERSWVDPLAVGIYPALRDRQAPGIAPGVPVFKGKDTVLERPDMETATAATVRPGAFAMHDPVTDEPFTVVWWDPQAIEARGEERQGLRREYLITKEARPEDVAADRARFDAWQSRRAQTIALGSRPSMAVLTATEWSKAVPAVEAVPDVTVDVVPARPGRPGGRRFGTLVHACWRRCRSTLLQRTCARSRRCKPGCSAHPRVKQTPRQCSSLTSSRTSCLLPQGRRASVGSCLREVPVSIVRDGVLIDGQADLAFEERSGWVVVDFKTDGEFALGEAIYRRQVALYAEAITHATGRPARGVLLRV